MSYLRRLLGLCNHTWDDVNMLKATAGGEVVKLAIAQRCSKCGDYRTVWH